MDAITPQPRAAWIAGRAEQGEGTLAVGHPYDGTEVATVAVPGPEQVERAVTAAGAAFAELRGTPAHVRAAALRGVADELTARTEEFAELLTAECGTPLRWAEAEVGEAASALRAGAATTLRLAGELQRLDSDAAGEGRLAVVRRVPGRPVLAALDVHGPLGLAARYTAAALAVGAPVVLAPAVGAPLSALALGEVLAGAGLPAGSFSVLPLAGTETLAADARLTAVHPPCPGTAAAVVLADWPDLGEAAARIAVAGTRQAGQAPESVRRVVVDAAVADEFVGRLTDAVRGQRTGDPYDTEVSVGPLPDEPAAQRLEAWLDEATAAGAKVLTGGARRGASVEPVLLTELSPDAAAWRAAAPGPALAVAVMDSPEQAFAAAAGPSAGVFTRDVEHALRASAALGASSVVVGDVPGYHPGSVRAAVGEITAEQVTVVPGPAW